MADIRITKTAKAIENALIEQLNEKEFAEITIQNLLDAAQINRTTFYNHYPNKNALAAALSNQFQADLTLIKNQTLGKPLTAFLEQAVPILFERRHLLQALWKIDTPKIHLLRDMQTLIKEHFYALKPVAERTYQTDLEANLFADLSLSTLRYYFGLDKEIDLEELFTALENVFALLKQGKAT